MTPPEDPARRRFAIISIIKVAGLAAMLLGMWLWWGNVIRPGGAAEIGLPLFIIGMATSMLLPRVLIRRWRTPPEQ